MSTSLGEILNGIDSLAYDATDPRMTGFYNFEAKKKLYQVLWRTQRQLNRCSKFVGEDEFLEEHLNQQMIEALKGR